MRNGLAILIFASMLAACGYKGPLYPSKPKPEAQKPAAPAPEAPAEKQ